MLALVACELSDGFRPAEVTVSVVDVRGKRHFFRIDRDFPSWVNGKPYATVGVVYIDPKGPVLVELPHEADSGANRLWVAREDILLNERVSA